MIPRTGANKPGGERARGRIVRGETAKGRISHNSLNSPQWRVARLRCQRPVVHRRGSVDVVAAWRSAAAGDGLTQSSTSTGRGRALAAARRPDSSTSAQPRPDQTTLSLTPLSAPHCNLNITLICKCKVLPEPQRPCGDGDLRFLSTQSDTSLHCKTVHGARLVHRAVCMFTPELSLVLIAPTHGGMARLSWPGWLLTYQDGLPACRWSRIQVLIGPGV